MTGVENLRDRNDFQDAITWLGSVGEWENKRYNPDIEFSESVDKTLHQLADRIAGGDSQTASLLADLERQAEIAVNPRPDLHSDYAEQIFRRRDQLYALTRLTPDKVEIPAASIVGSALGEGQYSAESSS